jgi:hypothetical protein
VNDQFDYWLDEAPVIALAASGQFVDWLDDAPLIEAGQGSDTQVRGVVVHCDTRERSRIQLMP